MLNGRNILKVMAFLAVFVMCFFGFVFLLSNGNDVNFSAIAEKSIQLTSGTLNYSDGSVYEGDILYGRIKNGVGTFSWATGETYSGSWENDIPSGYGKLEWPGFGKYEGNFYNGKRDGKGIFVWIYNSEPTQGAPISFDGEWTNDQIGSYGKLVLSGIGTYEGPFHNQLREGKGTFTWLNGDVYSGDWVKDEIDGTGVLKLANGSILQGDFLKGVIKKGTFSYPIQDGWVERVVTNGKTQAEVKIIYDNGTVVSGKLKGEEFTGDVSIRYASGDTYRGTMKNGLKDGKGTYTWKSGAHYIGKWVNDKMSGSGKYYYHKDESSTYLTGTFKNGVPDGKLVYVAETKLKYQTTWSNGICTSIKYKK